MLKMLNLLDNFHRIFMDNLTDLYTDYLLTSFREATATGPTTAGEGRQVGFENGDHGDTRRLSSILNGIQHSHLRFGHKRVFFELFLYFLSTSPGRPL
jgi:hypothetical protein